MGLMALASFLGVALLVAFFRYVVMGFFIGNIKGTSVKLNEEQFPEIYAIVKEQSLAIGLKEIPEVYVTEGNFNAFVTKFLRKKFLMLFSQVIETGSRGNYDVLRFVIGHELGHIKRKHLSSQLWFLPSVFIPFLNMAYSRGREYTCDRIGHHFSSDGAMEGILILAAGKEIYTKINVKNYLEQSQSEGSFWVWFSEKFSTHPYAFKRLNAVKRYAEKGY